MFTENSLGIQRGKNKEKHHLNSHCLKEFMPKFGCGSLMMLLWEHFSGLMLYKYYNIVLFYLFNSIDDGDTII